MLTVKDLVGALELELVAGERAAGAPIRWVHVSELEDPTPWLSGGELLLSTGMQLLDEDSQRAYVRQLVEPIFSQLAPAQSMWSEQLVSDHRNNSRSTVAGVQSLRELQRWELIGARTGT